MAMGSSFTSLSLSLSHPSLLIRQGTSLGLTKPWFTPMCSLYTWDSYIRKPFLTISFRLKVGRNTLQEKFDKNKNITCTYVLHKVKQ